MMLTVATLGDGDFFRMYAYAEMPEPPRSRQEQGLGASSFTLSFDLPDDGAAEDFYAVFSCDNTLRSHSEAANFNVFLSFSGGGKTLECASLLQYAPEEAHTT